MMKKSHGRLLCDAYELATYQYIENLVFFFATHRALMCGYIEGYILRQYGEITGRI